MSITIQAICRKSSPDKPARVGDGYNRYKQDAGITVTQEVDEYIGMLTYRLLFTGAVELRWLDGADQPPSERNDAG